MHYNWTRRNYVYSTNPIKKRLNSLNYDNTHIEVSKNDLCMCIVSERGNKEKLSLAVQSHDRAYIREALPYQTAARFPP